MLEKCGQGTALASGKVHPRLGNISQLLQAPLVPKEQGWCSQLFKHTVN